jgi:RecJ-like exonuclease
MNLTTLQSFCRNWGDISTPFYHNHFVYASDGYSAIRIPAENLDDVLPEKGNRNVAELAEKLDAYFAADYSEQESHTLGDFDFEEGTEPCEHCEGTGKLYACDECDGAGEVSYSTAYNDYEHECNTCDGKGYFTKSEWEREFSHGNIEYADTEDCEDCGGTGVLNANPDTYIGEVKFQGKLLKKFMQFEGATIKVDVAKKPALITWSNGQGILMPMRDAH